MPRVTTPTVASRIQPQPVVMRPQVSPTGNRLITDNGAGLRPGGNILSDQGGGLRRGGNILSDQGGGLRR
jgi:hypothetical protein